MSKYIPNKILKDIPNKISKNISNKISKNISNKIPKHLPIIKYIIIIIKIIRNKIFLIIFYIFLLYIKI